MYDKRCTALIKEGEGNERRAQKYLCSNPNCRKVFSKPKIIKYHVCPACQTLVDISHPVDEAEIQFYLASRTLKKPAKPKTVEAVSSGQFTIEVSLPDVEPLVDQPVMPEKQLEHSELETSEGVLVTQQAQVQLPEKVETPPTCQEKVAEKQVSSPSESSCDYGFGYLGQRGKGEVIPEGCLECSKAVSCMLSEYYKGEKSVSEINKWYKF